MLIFVDLETTGLDVRTCDVLEIAAVCRDRTGKRYHFRSLVNPGIDLTSEDLDPGIGRALEINHIDPATLTGAPSTEEVAGRFRLWLTERALDGPVKLAGFNSSRYDAVILSRPPWEIPINMWKYDVMDMAMEVMDRAGVLPHHPYYGKPKWPKLSEAAGYFGVDFDGDAHTALADVGVTMRIFERIKEGDHVGETGAIEAGP